VEFEITSNLQSPLRWQPETVTDIRICDDYDDKEGTPVQSVPWQDIRDYICFVVVGGTDHWGRNDQIRPIVTPDALEAFGAGLFKRSRSR
jgi:hypothetical protein